MNRAKQIPGKTPILALILDMDGLLVDSETIAAEALRAFLARCKRVSQE